MRKDAYNVMTDYQQRQKCMVSASTWSEENLAERIYPSICET